MGLSEFQIAFASLIASPQLCERTLIDEDSFFSTFDLTEREKLRLRSVLRQKGISACCTLYRMNRLTPIYTQLSNTSTLLGDDLLNYVEEFWLHYHDSTLQYRDEVLKFGSFLMEKIENDFIRIPYLKEVLQLEMAINELSYKPEGEYLIIKFGYNIIQVLQSINDNTLNMETIEEDHTLYKLYMENQKLNMDIL